ncbi:hypothetical protein E8E11_011680 [Didymella keratinophila]|nr:hypothetical protein E8E11_011680 [Didymella keratinophila]
MSGFTPLAPAQGPKAGVSAGAQQSPASQTVEPIKSHRPKRKDGQRKYKLSTRRRGKKDPYPGERESDTELQNVERIFHWVERGASTGTQRKVWWRNFRITVDKAHADMVKRYPGSCAHLNRGCCWDGPCWKDLAPPQQQALVLLAHMPRPPPHGPESLPTQQQGTQHSLFFSPQVSMPAQQGLSSADHSTGYLQDTALGVQPPFPQPQETYGSFPQASVRMPEHANFLQGQSMGYQNSPLQDLPVSLPVSQFPSGTGHGAEGLPTGPQQLDIAVFTPGFPLQENNALATPPVVEWMTGGYAAFFDHGSPDFPSSSPGSLPENPFTLDDDVSAPSGSLSTDLTMPDFTEGLLDNPVGLDPDMQEWLSATAQPAQDLGIDLSGTGTQFQNGAVGDLPADDWAIFEALCDAAAFREPMTQEDLF